MRFLATVSLPTQARFGGHRGILTTVDSTQTLKKDKISRTQPLSSVLLVGFS